MKRHNVKRRAQSAEGVAHGAWRKAKSTMLYEALCSWRYALNSTRYALGAVVSPYEDEDVLIDDDIGTRIGEPWKVVLYNDNIHTFDEVILQLQKAIGCSVQRAEQIAFEAHTKGKAVAFSGEFNECYRVMGVLREIQLVVEIEG